jgi:hypothetical protein
MITQAVANSWYLEIVLGMLAPEDVYRFALYSRDANLSEETTAYTTDGEVIGSPGYDAGGQILTGYKAVSLPGGAVLAFDTPVWPVSTITARGGLIYNFSKQNRAVAVLDFAKDYISSNGEFRATMPVWLIRVGAV